ncbi:MAG: diaminopimelate epimerase [Chitinophagales bacterium]
MKKFYKYQGTGNDFIIADNRNGEWQAMDSNQIAALCDRRFGIGADGLMLLENAEGYDFRMVYFNSDGNQSTMCGNGGRCLVSFAEYLKIVQKHCRFIAVDGPHQAEIPGPLVNLQMQDVKLVEKWNADYVLNTGSPHYVRFVQHVRNTDVYAEGRRLRYSAAFEKNGINVNFVEELTPGKIYVRTYERGVEDETRSCGTGVVAAAIAYFLKSGFSKNEIEIETPGGQLRVWFQYTNGTFTNVWLSGPAVKVFEGWV